MKTRFISILGSCIMGVLANSLLAQNPDTTAARKLKVKQGHPILFVNADLVRQIRAKTDECRQLGATVKKYRTRRTDDPNDTDTMRQEVTPFSNWTHPGEYLKTAMWYGVDAYINQNQLSVAYGREYLRAILAQDPLAARSPECHVLGSVFALGALYDWLYDDLDDELKHQTRLGILQVAGLLDSKWRFFREGMYVGGHATCWANPYALVGLVAIRHDIQLEAADVQARYFELLGKVARNIRDGIAPVHAWVGKDGGHHMGWDYGTCYTTMLPYTVWEFATDEDSLFGDWQNQHTYWYLYGLRNEAPRTFRGDRKLVSKMYGQYPYSGDCYGTQFSGPKEANLLAASLHYGNPHAKWLLNHFRDEKNTNVSPDALLYRHFAPDEGTAPSDLPLSRCFRNAGFTVMRDSWDFERNTLAVFKSSPFYSMNHHHKDQNSFTVYYRGPLAIDSGGYSLGGSYGSRHWHNYYTRSVAHNTLLVYDPAEDFGTRKWGKRSNDGGQRFGREPGSIGDIRGSSALDGIMHYENHPDYTYTMGDATKAYSAHKLELFQRHFVYLRRHSYDHPVILVYDRVVSKNASFKKTYLLHSIGKPVVNDRMVRIEVSDGVDPAKTGRLHNQVILPADATIRAIGGIENDQEFYVADDGTGKPHNYREEFAAKFPEEAAVKAIDREKGMFREIGAWRVEVSPKAERLDDRFLNVLSVTDGTDEFLPVRTQYVGSDSFDSVLIEDNDGQESTLVIIRRAEQPFRDAVFPETNCRRVLLIGFTPGQHCLVTRADNALHVTQAAAKTAGSVQVSDQGTAYAKLTP